MVNLPNNIDMASLLKSMGNSSGNVDFSSPSVGGATVPYNPVKDTTLADYPKNTAYTPETLAIMNSQSKPVSAPISTEKSTPTQTSVSKPVASVPASATATPDISSMGLSPETLKALNDAYVSSVNTPSTSVPEWHGMTPSTMTGILSGLIALGSRGKAGSNPLENTGAFVGGSLSDVSERGRASEIEQQNKNRQYQQEKMQNIAGMLMKQPEIKLAYDKYLTETQQKGQELNLQAEKQKVEKILADNTIANDAKQRAIQDYTSKVNAVKEQNASMGGIQKLFGIGREDVPEDTNNKSGATNAGLKWSVIP